MKAGFHIVADENIVLVREYFSPFGVINLVDGYSLSTEEIQDAEILLIRSVTRVDADLLSKMRHLRFVASATTGTDHVDIELLKARQIPFAHAPGSNADSVVEYVLSAAVRAFAGIEDWSALRVGVIGHGTIGSRVTSRFEALGCSVIANDPPLEQRTNEASGDGPRFASLEEVLATCDLITIHVPLVEAGQSPTVGLIDEHKVRILSKGTVIVNTSRGQVITREALHEMIDSGVELILDVWPNEPAPDSHLVQRAFISTPHIAGYSYDGKVLGTRMIRDGMIQALGILESDETYRVPDPPVIPLDVDRITVASWPSVVSSMYNVREDSERFKSGYLGSDAPAKEFVRQRRDYPQRRSFGSYTVKKDQVDPAAVPIVESVLEAMIV